MIRLYNSSEDLTARYCFDIMHWFLKANEVYFGHFYLQTLADFMYLISNLYVEHIYILKIGIQFNLQMNFQAKN